MGTRMCIITILIYYFTVLRAQNAQVISIIFVIHTIYLFTSGNSAVYTAEKNIFKKAMSTNCMPPCAGPSIGKGEHSMGSAEELIHSPFSATLLS